MKTKSSQAQVAKLCKQYITKTFGIKCRATSESFSMGDSVTVTIYNQPPEVKKQIEDYCSKFQYGHFDGMTDYYEMSNRRDDIPQTKYLHVNNDISDELHQAAWEYMKKNFQGGDELPDNYKDGGTSRIFDDWAQSVNYRVISGYMKAESEEFWKEYQATNAPKQVTSSAVKVDGFTIEEHTHTKKGFQMFICIMPGRVDRDTFTALRDKAKAMGGWYSRQWGATPAGFAFKDQEAAQAFCNGEDTTARPDNGPTAPVQNTGAADKLRDLAVKLQSIIDNKLSDRLTNTPKRLAQAAHARLEGERLQRTQTALNHLANMHEAGTIPAEFSHIKTKAAVYDLMGTKKEPVQNGYHTYHICTGEPNNDSPTARFLWSLVEGKTEEQKREEDIARRRNELKFAKIPGYFPTPDSIIDMMIEFADLEPGQSILEPSAGDGAICRAVNGHDGRKVAIEYNHTLKTLLRDTLEKWDVHGGDFLNDFNLDSLGKFDRIIMNPPFDMGADIKHIKQAAGMLTEGGRLVALCAGGPRQINDLQPISDHWEMLPAGSFKEAGTMVNVCLLVINN